MNLRRPILFAVAVLLVLGISACERSLTPRTQSPVATQPGGEQPLVTGDVMGQLELFVTQTAMATQGLGTGQQATPAAPTPQAVLETAVPGAEATAPVPQETPVAPEPVEPTAIPPTEIPQSTMVPVPSPTPGLPSTYVLKTGEHPYCIARRYNVDPIEMLRASGLGTNSTVYAGMELTIPQTGNPFPAERSLLPHPSTHTVSAGETIYSIACQFGDVSPEAIAFANGLSEPYQLSAGQQLHIP